MLLEDKIPKNKNINSLEIKEAKHPLLQLLYNNKRKDGHNKIQIKDNKNAKKFKFSDLLNLKYRRKSISYIKEIKLNNITPKKNKINNNDNLSEYKLNNSNSFSCNSSKSESKEEKNNKNGQLNNIKNIKKINLSKNPVFNERKDISILPDTNIIFPNLTQSKNLFNLKKKPKDGNIFEHNKESDFLHNNINFNNKTIFVSEAKSFRHNNNQKFFGDKVLCQKTVEFSLLMNKSPKNSFKNLTLKETYPNNLPDFEIYSEKNNNKDIFFTPDKKIKNNTINQSNKNNNNLINKFTTENTELNSIFNQSKTINFSNKLILFKKDKNNPFNLDKSKDFDKRKSFILYKKDKNNPFNLDKSKYFDKRKSFISLKPRDNKDLDSKELLKTFNPETLSVTQSAKRRINIKKISNNKKFFKIKNENKKKNNRNNNIILSPIKTNIQKFFNNMNINDEIKETPKHFISKKDISNNPLSKFYNLISKQNKLNKNCNYEDSLFTDNEPIKKSDNIIVLQSSTTYYDINRIFCKQLLNKDEDEYINKKRAKILEKVLKNNKESSLYNSYNEEIKNYYLKNYAIDKITERIFENFEPLENRIENIKEKIEKQEKELKEILLEILNKSHKYCFSMNKIIKLGMSLLKGKKINKKVKIENHYILEMFDIYPSLLKQFEIKWNNKRRKEYYYKKMIEIFSSRDEISNTKVNKRISLALDKDYFIYKERINNEINIDLSINTLHLKIKNEKERRDSKSSNNSRKRLSTVKYKNILNTKFNSKIQILSQFAQNKIDKNDSKKNLKKIARVATINAKVDNLTKIQKEIGFTKHNENFEKFAKLYRISQKPLITFPNKKNNENEDKKIFNFNLEKESKFNTVKANLDNYNILKNRKIFRYSNTKQFNLEKRFSQIYKSHKNKIQLDKKNKIDNITIKFAGMDQLTKEAATIKTQEIERDLPDTKLFDKFVSVIQRRKLNLFDILIQKKEEGFNRIINKQEFNTGNTLLIYCTQNNLKSLVELLLLKGADPNIKNKFGNTALHIAFKNDNVFIINLLLEYKADQKIKNNNGLLPWQLSKSINN